MSMSEDKLRQAAKELLAIRLERAIAETRQKDGDEVAQDAEVEEQVRVVKAAIAAIVDEKRELRRIRAGVWMIGAARNSETHIAALDWCSCQDHRYRRRRCKHMVAVSALEELYERHQHREGASASQDEATA